MSNMICVEKAKPSSLKRLRFLPRFGLVVDFAGQQFSYRQAPLLEAFVNMRSKGKFSMKNFMEVAFQQLKEIQLTEQKNFAEACPPSKLVKAKTKKKK